MPLPDLPVLQDHVDGEAVEEDEDGSKDVVDEGGDCPRRAGSGTEEVHADDDPGNEADHGAEDERCPVGPRCRLFVQFHHEPEQVHRRIQTEYHDGAGKVVHARQLGNDDDHDRRAQRVFAPSDVADAAP